MKKMQKKITYRRRRSYTASLPQVESISFCLLLALMTRHGGVNGVRGVLQLTVNNQSELDKITIHKSDRKESPLTIFVLFVILFAFKPHVHGTFNLNLHSI